jgi:large subunit ribosomal protein L9
MQIILLQDVDKVGLRGDVVSVADGFARNYLLPRRFAEQATPAKVAELRKRDALRARQEARTAEEAQQIAEVLAEAELRFDVAAGPTGRLFGSVTPTNIADEIWQAKKIRVDRRKIRLSEPIKRIGRHEVPIEIFQDVVAGVTALVVPEGGELPSEEELAAMEAEERTEELAAAEEAETSSPQEPPAEELAAAEASGPEEPPAEELQVPDDTFDRAVDVEGRPEPALQTEDE